METGNGNGNGEMMEMEKQMTEMQVDMCCWVSCLHWHPRVPPPHLKFICSVVVIICTLPCDRFLMSICCLPGLMSSVLCYYSCKVPFIRLAIWLAL